MGSDGAMAGRPTPQVVARPAAPVATGIGLPSGEDLWYKDAVIYELHVRTFYDANGDGVGDFQGLTEKLDYLQELGITAVWLLPFYPSPLADDGYDIADYMGVHPAYGTLQDFRRFLQEAHGRGIRVITDLVLNHTSDRHPWFQRARRARPGSPWRDFYVWSSTPDRYRLARVIFPSFESSNWTWDEVAGAYYWHRFYSHQPDLNYDNPLVWKAMFRVVDFWLRQGVDGFRLDAVPYLYEREGTTCAGLPETHAFVRALRRYIEGRHGPRVLLAEANEPAQELASYLQGDQCHLAFHFPLMPRLYLALHRQDAEPVVTLLRDQPAIADTCQWALFLRNHDELSLEMVTPEEREELLQAYAPDPQARVHWGIRRRLAPLLANDRRRWELMNGLLFCLPGTPVIYYGDEIGMGDNIALPDRHGVRTPMQWSGERNAGFSRAEPERLCAPVVVDPAFHYRAVNVEAQRTHGGSLLNWMKRLIALRKAHPALRRGRFHLVETDNRKVLAFLRIHPDETILVVANWSAAPQRVSLRLPHWRDRVPVDLLGGSALPPVATEPYSLTLAPFGLHWLRLEDQRPTAEPVLAPAAPAFGPCPPGEQEACGGPRNLAGAAAGQGPVGGSGRP